jgi:RNA polymerase sigma-70 factor (ECF subfamily)
MRPIHAHDLRDPSAFAHAYGQHAGAVHRTAVSVLGDAAAAHDVVHDVFLRLWCRPDAYDADRGGLGPYLRLMARSRALDLWREARAADRTRERLRVVAERAGDESPAIDRQDLLAALRELSPGQREALLLAYWGGMTTAEISHASGVPHGTVKSRVRLGLLQLRRAHEAAPAAA